jgi:glucose/arabinose dehydrogenase
MPTMHKRFSRSAILFATFGAVAVSACAPASAPSAATPSGDGAATAAVTGNSVNVGAVAATPLAGAPFTATPVADFEDPWAIAFLPGSSQALITEKSGRLMLWQEGTEARAVNGVPAVSYAGQGGLGDVVLAPDFQTSRMVYLSWAAEGPGGKGAVVGRGRLSVDSSALEGFTEIWRATPFISGNGHFGHRMAFGPDGMLYIATGERQRFTPAQDMAGTLGKIIRLNPDGSVPTDNPFAAEGGVKAQIWASGLRNPLGLGFDRDGRLWELEMGPEGGDELNIITRGANYGYPARSNGRNYGAATDDMPDHTPDDGFTSPLLWWTPAMSPGGMMIYSGNRFAAWRGDALIAALGGRALIRVNLNGANAAQAGRWDMGMRVRGVAQSPDGGIWLLEDGASRGQGRLFRLDPR